MSRSAPASAGRDPAGPFEQVEQLAVGARLPQPLVGHDVRRGVEDRLDRDLQRVLHEPRLANVGRDRRRAGQLAQLADARLDDREPFRDQLRHRSSGRRRQPPIRAEHRLQVEPQVARPHLESDAQGGILVQEKRRRHAARGRTGRRAPGSGIRPPCAGRAGVRISPSRRSWQRVERPRRIAPVENRHVDVAPDVVVPPRNAAEEPGGDDVPVDRAHPKYRSSCCAIMPFFRLDSDYRHRRRRRVIAGRTEAPAERQREPRSKPASSAPTTVSS